MGKWVVAETSLLGGGRNVSPRYFGRMVSRSSGKDEQINEKRSLGKAYWRFSCLPQKKEFTLSTQMKGPSFGLQLQWNVLYHRIPFSFVPFRDDKPNEECI
eukprot:scaffold1506_cov179-Amphora_coffeaeformis.AAC.5